jgi:hypothetical protein
MWTNLFCVFVIVLLTSMCVALHISEQQQPQSSGNFPSRIYSRSN